MLWERRGLDEMGMVLDSSELGSFVKLHILYVE